MEKDGMKKRPNRKFFQWLCILTLPFFLTKYADAQAVPSVSRLAMGIELFSQGRLGESVLELRRLQAEATSRELRAEALFWISIAQLFAGEYEQALRDMNTLEQTDPANRRLAQLPYHRGRALFQLGRYDEAIVFLMRYADGILPGPGGIFTASDASRKAAALYWAGACLFSMGQFDRASDMFMHVIETFPSSIKAVASNNRIAMINQRRVEAELLTLLRWSHEESMRNMEEFRRREMLYNQALVAYQRQVASLLRGGVRVAELEYENQNVLQQLREAADRILYLETLLLNLRRYIQGFENNPQGSGGNFGGTIR